VHEALTDLRVEASELTYLRLGGDGQSAPSEVPLEDSLGALAELRDQGLIRRIGLSGATPGQLRRARAMTPIAAVQNRYNLLDRSGVEVLADCEAQGIAFVPYWPLALGQLAEHEELQAPARRLGATGAQVALAFGPARAIHPRCAQPPCRENGLGVADQAAAVSTSVA
jgi:aryl-alcohol dehydrogenase-like predicted oxidoreductase